MSRVRPGAGGRWCGWALGSDSSGPRPTVMARVLTGTPTRDAPGRALFSLGAVWGGLGLAPAKSARRPGPLACRLRALGSGLGSQPRPRRTVHTGTRKTACNFRNGAPGSCRPPCPRREMLGSREPQLLLRGYQALCASGCFSPTPGNRGWPWGGLHALDMRRRRAESRGSEG